MSFHNIVVNTVVKYYYDYTTMYYKLTSKAINMIALRKKQSTLPSTLIIIIMIKDASMSVAASWRGRVGVRSLQDNS